MAQASLRRINLVRETIGKVTRIISETKNVSVTQAGSEAFVKRDNAGNPTQINIPSIADDASDAYLDAIQGFMDKECAEVLFIDHAVRREVEKQKDEELSSIFKLVEECFTERQMRMKYEGSKVNLAKVSDIYIDRIVKPQLAQAITEGKPEQELFKIIAPSFFRSQAGQMSFAGFAREMEFDKLIPNLYKELADLLEEELPKVDSSASALELAELIRSIFEKKRQEQKGGGGSGKQNQQGGGGMKGQGQAGAGKGKPQKGGSSGGGGKPKKGNSGGEEEQDEAEGAGGGGADAKEDEDEQQGSGAGGPGGEDEAEASANPEGEGDDPADAAGDDEGEDGDAGSEHGGDKPPQEDDPEWHEDTERHEGEDRTSNADDIMWESVSFGKNSFMGEMSNFIKKHSEESLKKNPEQVYVPYTRDWDLIQPYEIRQNYDYSGIVNKIEGLIHPMVGPLKKQIQAAYFVMNRSFYVPGKRSGRINPNSLSKLQMNDDRVFRQKEEHKTQEVAISIVIDQSGSMGGEKVKTAVCGAYAIAEVLHQLGISFEIIAFTTGSGNERAGALRAQMNAAGVDEYGNRKPGYARTGPIHIYEYKRFDEIFSSTQRKRLAHLFEFQEYMHSNVDGESLEYAAMRLMRRPELGKSMIVLSDGQPAGPGNGWAFHHHLVRVVKQLQNEAKINMIGIGIQTDSVMQYYPKHILVDNIKDLPDKMLRSLKAEILRKA